MFNFLDNEMKFCEYFVSLEGEGYTIGESVLFMRLAGGCGKNGLCSCKFCDTKYSWVVKPEHWDLKDIEFREKILESVAGRNIRRVTLTGGEPLKYADNFYDFVQDIQYLLPNVAYVGIESNGAMLAEEKNAVEVLKQFNWISKIGIEPMLTMSPKIEYATSWSHHKDMDQEAVNKLYFEVFKNAENIIAPFKVFYKFVYDFTNETIDWEHTKYFIQELLTLGVPQERIMLMALTPDDPHGKDKEFWETSQRQTAIKALEIGVRYSPRLHVNLDMD